MPPTIMCQDGGHASSRAPTNAVGADSDSYRHLIGLDAIDTEFYAGWLAFPRSLREHGVDGVL